MTNIKGFCSLLNKYSNINYKRYFIKSIIKSNDRQLK